MATAMKSKRLSEKSSPVIKAGGNKMAPQTGAAPVVAGQVSNGGRAGNNTFKVSGGKGHMAGFTGSTPAKPV